MRVFLFLLLACLVLSVLVEGRSSKDSKDHGRKGPASEGRVTKVRPKHTHHHAHDSSDSSEEHHNHHNHRHKHKKKHSEKFKSEEGSDWRTNHRIKHNSTRIFGDGFNDKSGKLISLSKNTTSHNNISGHNGNKTLIGWNAFAKPDMSKNETNSQVLNNFLHSEKGVKVVNGSQLNHNNNNWNYNGTAPNYGWKNFNATPPSDGWKNFNATGLSQGWKNFNATGFSQGWQNFNATGLSHGWQNFNATGPSQGWQNFKATGHSLGWKNFNATGFSQGWQNFNGTGPSQGWQNFNATGLSHGWQNFNATGPSQVWQNFNATGLSHGWQNFKATGHSQGWKNFNATGFSQGWQNFNPTGLSHGWQNFNATGPSQGWQNFNATSPSQGWKINTNPVQGWNVEPSAPDYRKDFSAPDHTKDQQYFNFPGAGYFQRNPNSINYNNQPALPIVPDYNTKMISNVAPEYSWGPQSFSNDPYNTGQFNPIHSSYSSEESSSKISKGIKKMFKKIGKGAGAALSSDQVKDSMKQAASSYFANPPPSGWIYNPPYSDTRQTYYGRFSNSVGKPPLTPDDWRSVIFGNVPRKVETRSLYSASFPETYQNLDLSALSEKGRLPDFNRTQYKSFFPRPYYQKMFAGLQNEDLNEHRTKRELSEKGKEMAKVINNFFMHERDCNDTDLDARKKRHVEITPITKNNRSRNDRDEIITDFPFSGVEAIVQSDYGISVYEEEPKQLNNTSEIIENITSDRTEHITTQPSTSKNRTKLYPVSETMEQFLNKKPATRLRAINEPLEKWKPRFQSTLVSQEMGNPTNKRTARSDETSNSTPFYSWIMDFTKNYKDIESGIMFNEKSTPGMSFEDSNESSTSSEDNSQKDETSSYSTETTENNKFYFFGAYIDNYGNFKFKDSDLIESEENPGRTTPIPDSFTESQTALKLRTLAIPALSYSDQEETSTEQVHITTEATTSKPVVNTRSNLYTIPKFSVFLDFLPFKVHTISPVSSFNVTQKELRNRSKEDEAVTAETYIIRAPSIKINCGPNQRSIKGVCRTIW